MMDWIQSGLPVWNPDADIRVGGRPVYAGGPRRSYEKHLPTFLRSRFEHDKTGFSEIPVLQFAINKCLPD